jgi:ParB family chromosome partitioning protein
LLGDDGQTKTTSEMSRTIQKAPIEFLRPNPRNPRKTFSEGDLDELAASIRERGVIQPILVRIVPLVSDAYEIIAGERRWRAAQRAGLHEIPILVLEADDRDALEIAIIENIQRTDLNALEEASGYAQLAADHGYTQSDIARIVGKSRSHITNILRLTNLPPHTKSLLASGAISAGHARALLAVNDPDVMADRVVSQQLTVRDVERLGENPRKSPLANDKRLARTDPDTLSLERRLITSLGTTVKVRQNGGAGDIRIAFRTLEQLHEICRRLTT